MKEVRLGVNIDHVATLRQARGESYPSIVQAAKVSLESGADQITIHLREDRRHIQDYDVTAVKAVTKSFNKPLNLEIGSDNEIVDIAIDIKPEWVCIVPEKREERTTEGGLNLLDSKSFTKIEGICEKLKSSAPNTKISLFVESDIKVLKECAKLEVDAVEIHTGDYAISYNNDEDIEQHIKKFKEAKVFCQENKISFHAGHGLTQENLVPLVQANLFVEYNIGHWIIADSLFCGLESSIKKLIKIIK